MNTFTIYKGIKQRVNSVAPCFYYLGQYLKGKDNTSYVVPAIYIEMPKYLSTDFFAQKLKVAKKAQVKIHLITNAPFKNTDTVPQDSALAEHQTKLDAVDKLLTGWNLKDSEQKLFTQQFIPVAASVMNYEGLKIYSVLTYTTEFYSRHLQ